MAQSPSIYPIANLELAFIDKKSLWAAINNIIQNKKLGFYSYHWDREIFIPFHTLISHYHEAFDPIIDYPGYQKDHQSQFILYIAAIAAWRYNLGVYNIPEYLYSLLTRDKNGFRISPPHIQNISEWTIYVPLNNVYMYDQPIHGVYVHKNVLNDGTPCVVMFLNSLNSERNASFSFLPYALFRVIETENILEALIECSPLFNEENFLEVFNPIFSLINLIGDENTVIESEIFGIHTPSYKDIKESISFSHLNQPTFKYVAPSNARNWNVGLNIAATHFKLATLHGDDAVFPVFWSDGDILKLVHPHL